ncbi:MAG: 3'-5' exonuclease [Gordonia sp. (in: high G+C Gram-positive bacteria)]
MNTIVMGPNKGISDGSLAAPIMNFLGKLGKDDTASGLHIEPINNSADKRARTGRVNQSFRAVVYKLVDSAGHVTYVYVGTFGHDEGTEFARTHVLKVNENSGITELIKQTMPSDEVPSPPTAPPVPQSVDITVDRKSLRECEFILSDLTDLGIDATLAEAALEISNDDEFEAILTSDYPAWQSTAMLDIYMGTSLAEVRSIYELDRKSGTSEDDDSDDATIAGLKHPAARMEFGFIEPDDDLESAIKEPDFNRWRLYLHPSQAKFANGDYSKSYRVTGGAGTGKTVILLHRARMLAQKNPQARIVLTTFNKVLAESLADQMRRLSKTVTFAKNPGDVGVFIGSIDSIAHRVLTGAKTLGDSDGEPGPVSRVLGSRTPSIMGDVGRFPWKAAIYAVPDLPAELRSESFFQAEYTTVVLPNRTTTEAQYLKVRRQGRGVALNKARRKQVWSVIAGYRASAAVDGATDFDERIAIAAEVLRTTGPIADHVLVDEAQDLTPSRLQLLRALVAPGPNDLFLAEDGHQRIYGQRIVLSHYDIDVRGAARKLTLNYRTTKQNLDYALTILSGADYTDLSGDAEGTADYRSSRRGPDPVMIQADNLADEYAKIAATVTTWIDEGVAGQAIGLLVPTQNQAQQLTAALRERDVSSVLVDRDTRSSREAPQVMTMHRSKGMEFQRVVLSGVSEKNVPRKHLVDSLPEGEREDAVRRERSLLYVAATRARDALVVVWSGKKSSILGDD